MKSSTIQATLLAFAFGANALPTQERAKNFDISDILDLPALMSELPSLSTKIPAIQSGIAAIMADFGLDARADGTTKTTSNTKSAARKTSTKATGTKAKTTTTSAADSVATDKSNDAETSSSAKAKTTGTSKAKTSSAAKSGTTKTSSNASASSTKATTTSKASSGSSGSSGSLPASSGTSALSAVKTIAAGESFDGGMVMYDRGVSCTGQSEGGDSDAVFQIENGGSISNVIIGPNQAEGIHCQGACTLTNVWWSAVCEDAFTIKNQAAGETTKIVGGGAYGASDKVMQHNGGGTLSISNFVVDDFGKLYRSCGNCKTMYERHVIMDGITASSGKELAGINYNYGDTATITNTKATGVTDICVTYTGTDDNSQEPTEYGSGADGKYCIYGSDVTSS